MWPFIFFLILRSSFLYNKTLMSSSTFSFIYKFKQLLQVLGGNTFTKVVSILCMFMFCDLHVVLLQLSVFCHWLSLFVQWQSSVERWNGHSLFPFLLQSSSGSHKRRNAHALKRARTLTHHSCRFSTILILLSLSQSVGRGRRFFQSHWLLAVQTRGLRKKREKKTGFLLLGTKSIL